MHQYDGPGGTIFAGSYETQKTLSAWGSYLERIEAPFPGFLGQRRNLRNGTAFTAKGINWLIYQEKGLSWNFKSQPPLIMASDRLSYGAFKRKAFIGAPLALVRDDGKWVAHRVYDRHSFLVPSTWTINPELAPNDVVAIGMLVVTLLYRMAFNEVVHGNGPR